jgi:hypothetical protein
MPGMMLDHRHRAQSVFARVLGKGGFTGEADFRISAGNAGDVAT